MDSRNFSKLPSGEGDRVYYKGRQWKRRALGAFLNLVVLPGSGSLVLGRKGEGLAQILMTVSGLGLKVAGAGALMARAGAELGRTGGVVDLNNPQQLALEISLAIHSSPPTILGLNAVWFFVGGLGLVVAAWLFSLVSTLLPPKVNARRAD